MESRKVQKPNGLCSKPPCAQRQLLVSLLFFWKDFLHIKTSIFVQRYQILMVWLNQT